MTGERLLGFLALRVVERAAQRLELNEAGQAELFAVLTDELRRAACLGVEAAEGAVVAGDSPAGGAAAVYREAFRAGLMPDDDRREET
jgi:folate-dependent tRNA-U54 methylase TrmFO/GidA